MSSNIDLVIFGARGDLARRKLLPALYQLDKAGLLPDSTRVAAVARENTIAKRKKLGNWKFIFYIIGY